MSRHLIEVTQITSLTPQVRTGFYENFGSLYYVNCPGGIPICLGTTLAMLPPPEPEPAGGSVTAETLLRAMAIVSGVESGYRLPS